MNGALADSVFMKTARIRPLPMLLALAALFAASSLLAHADGYGFSPPVGWRAQRPPASYAGLWISPLGREAVNLATVSASTLGGLVNGQMQRARAQYPGLHVYSNVAYHVCGRHDARYLIWTSTSHGAQWIHEQVMADWEGTGYVASYVRPGTYPPSRAARASITSVCGVAGGSLSNPSAPQGQSPGAPAQPASNAVTEAPAAAATATPYVYPSITPRYMPVIPM